MQFVMVLMMTATATAAPAPAAPTKAAAPATTSAATAAATSAATAAATSAAATEVTAEPQLVRKSRPFSLSGGDEVTVDVIVVVPGQKKGVDDGELQADAALDEVQRVLTLFDAGRDDGPLARLNQGAGKAALVMDPEVFEVLGALHRIAKLSKGAFDVTAAAYDDAWRFDGADPAPGAAGAVASEGGASEEGAAVTAPREPPQKVEIDRLRQLVSVEDLVLDPVARTARLKKAGARIDLHAVIKGYALDRARAVLLGRGVSDFVLSCGGDVVVSGNKGARPWMVGVQDPRAPGPFLALPVDVKSLGGAVMTSSDNESFFLVSGVRYHSILDPRTGLPSTRSRSVTVLHDDALVADALSRAVFVLGEKEGLKLIERLPGANAVVVTADNRVVLSKGLQKLATAQALQQRPPTDGP